MSDENKGLTAEQIAGLQDILGITENNAPHESVHMSPIPAETPYDRDEPVNAATIGMSIPEVSPEYKDIDLNQLEENAKINEAVNWETGGEKLSQEELTALGHKSDAEIRKQLKIQEIKKQLNEEPEFGMGYAGVQDQFGGQLSPNASDEEIENLAEILVAKEIDAEGEDVIADERQMQLEKERAVRARKAKLERAKKYGFEVAPDPIDDLIAETEMQEVQEKLTPGLEEINQKADEIRNAEAEAVAAEQLAADEEQAAARKEELVKAQIEEEDQKAREEVEIEKQSGDSFWSKIGFVLAAAISGAIDGRAGRGGNTFLTAYNNAIDRKLKQEQLSEKQKIAKKKAYWENALKESQIAANRNKSAKAQLEIKKLQQEIGENINKLSMEQLAKNSLASGEGLSQQEFQELVGFDRKEGAHWVQYNNRMYRANNEKEAARLYDNLQNVDDAYYMIDQLERMGNLSVGDKLYDKAIGGQADLLKKSIIGKMRIELFGPGVLTDNEREAAEKMLGDPTSVSGIIFPEAEMRKLESLKERINLGKKRRLRLSGINLPLTQKEQILEKARQEYPQMTDWQIIDSLKEKGLWN